MKKQTVGGVANVRARVIQEFTEISDPPETPRDADVILDTNDLYD